MGAQLPFTGTSGSTFGFNVTGTIGWPAAGLGTGSSPWTYTPQQSGTLQVRVQGPIGGAVAVNRGLRIQYGTGTAPQPGGTGGKPVPYAQNMINSTSNLPEPVHLFGILSNLALGLQYWFDVCTAPTSPMVITLGSTGPAIPMTITWQEM
jgi:hypothetical protein